MGLDKKRWWALQSQAV